MKINQIKIIAKYVPIGHLADPKESAFIFLNKDGMPHRENNLPASISADIHTIWFFVHGKAHRTDGPAKITFWPGEGCGLIWYIEDLFVSHRFFACRDLPLDLFKGLQ